MGYIKGKDLLVSIGGKCVGHCTSHSITYNTETAEHAVKPPASDPVATGLFKGKEVTGLSISLSFEGLRYYDEKENSCEDFAAMWGAGTSVEVKAFRRKNDTKPYLEGKFVIESLTEDSPADGDASYSGQMSNDGEPATFPGKATAAAAG